MLVPDRARLFGTLSVAAALAVQWSLHRIDPAWPFAPHGAGNRVIRHTPVEVSNLLIGWLETDAKPLLAVLLVTGALSLGYVIGARRAVLLGLLALGLSLGAMAIDPAQVAVSHALMSSIAAGIVAFAVALVGRRLSALPVPRPEHYAMETVADPGRRRVLQLGIAGSGALVLAGALGAWRLLREQAEYVTTAALQVIGVSEHDPAFAEIHGLSPLVTPTGDHYVISIGFSPPALTDSGWNLPIHGAVANPVAFTLADLRAMPGVERPVVMCCISNPLGGEYVGNAYWTGVPLKQLLARAQVQPSAVQVLLNAYDGYSETIDLDVLDREDVLVVYAMNGEPLARDHGFPARLLHIGRFGMRSVKWLSDVELIPDRRLGYWEQRDWDLEAVMKTQARIDAPRGSKVAGEFVVAGVAWAGARGVDRVEVSIDGGTTWLPAQLEAPLGPYTWRRWQRRLHPDLGWRTVRVRVTDGEGNLQDGRLSAPFPSGATGYHTVGMSVVDPEVEPPTGPPDLPHPDPNPWPTN